jgi:hypothetical protein
MQLFERAPGYGSRPVSVRRTAPRWPRVIHERSDARAELEAETLPANSCRAYDSRITCSCLLRCKLASAPALTGMRELEMPPVAIDLAGLDAAVAGFNARRTILVGS